MEITSEQLKDLVSAAVTAAVAEAKKPAPPTEQEISKHQMEQQQRLEMSQSVKDKKANERQMQLACTHEHPKRDGGHTHCVYIREDDPRSAGYVLCQECQGRFRPESADARKLDPNAIFDTSIFNRLFQECVSGSIQ